MATSNGAGQDHVVVPYEVLYQRLDDDTDTEQHKGHRMQETHMKSIRHYRHATTKWGAALESFSPLWVRSGVKGVV